MKISSRKVLIILFGICFNGICGLSKRSRLFERKNYKVIDCDKKETVQMRIPSSISCSSLCLNKDKCQTYDYKGKFCTLYEGITQVEPDETTGAFTTLTEDELQSLTTVSTIITSTTTPVTTTFTTTTTTTTKRTTTKDPRQYEYFKVGERWIKLGRGSELTWQKALEYCRENGFHEARLVVIKHTNDIDQLVTLLGEGQKYWIGLNDSDNESQEGFGQWEWLDGSTLNDNFGGRLLVSDDTDINDYAMVENIDRVRVKITFNPVESTSSLCICEAPPFVN